MGRKSVRVYYNTGFNGLDIPGSPAVLDTLPYRDYNDIYFLREDIDLPAIKLNVPYDEIKNVDYVRISATGENDTYYFATPRAEAKNTTVLYLSLDALLTMGGAENLDYLSGWITRGHIAKAADTLFSNIAPEDFVPSQPMKIGGWTVISGPETGGSDKSLIVTNVDLTQISQTASQAGVIAGIVVGQTDPVMYLPEIKVNQTTLRFEMSADPGGGTGMVSFSLPNTAAYDATNATVRAALGKLYSFGQLQLVSAYTLPGEWISAIAEAFGAIVTLQGAHGRVSVTGGITGTYKNNKVFAMFRTANLLSLASGDKMTAPIYDVADSAGAVQVNVWADPAPTGKPYARFTRVMGNTAVYPYLNSVAGSQWANSQLVMEGASGSAWNSLNAAFGRAAQSAQYENDVLQNNIAGQAISARGELQEARANAGFFTGLAGAIGSGAAMFGSGGTLAPVAGGALVGSVVSLATQQQQNAYNASEIQRERQVNEANAELLDRQRRINLNENRVNELRANNIVAPSVFFPPEINLGLYGYNRFAYYETVMSNTDLAELDSYFQRYGYNGVHIPLTRAAITSRQYYNFVQAMGINFKRATTAAGAFGLRVREKAIAQLNSGVRIWHVAPDPTLYDTN